jgi:phosphotransacetylase
VFVITSCPFVTFSAVTAFWFILVAAAITGATQACAHVLPFAFQIIALSPGRVVTGSATVSSGPV